MAKQAEDTHTIDMHSMPATRGRPVTGRAKSAAQRQRDSRARRKNQNPQAWRPYNFAALLSSEAAEALHMLAHYGQRSKKETIERLLLDAYRDFRGQG